ncbi:hypothetical protein [Sporolactobacillus putidus]|uniref:Nuclease-related domain-containing protein n=1 Tax=Sporolactobacillus putidus TaxID=492735 RepID=A0A917W329_9BACL|nr:hypothetical protein [Sporolactobacillus putidus]GGL62229.1 hypothetical protein GCM10007968_27770 [Sporolactobacillus putidus]
MLQVIYLMIILILAGIIYFLIQKQKKIRSQAEEWIEKSRNETASTINETENRLKEESETKIKNIMTENSATIAGIEESYEKRLGRYEELIDYLQGAQRSEKTFTAYQHLAAIKKILVQSNRISSQQMVVAGNAIVPAKTVGGDLSVVRADILFLLPTGLYVVDTKRYRGKIFHGMNTENAQGFERLIGEIVPKPESGTEETLILSKRMEQGNSNENFLRITIDCHSDISAPVMKATSEFRAYLSDHRISVERIVPVIYFMDDSADQMKTENFSERERPLICLSQNDLYQMISQELDQEEWILATEKIQKIKQLISEINH